MAPKAASAEVGPTSDGKVNIRLAHPLGVRDLINLGLDPDTEANAGSVIEVTRDQGVSLMGAGYVNVDPNDRAAVVALFEGEKAAEDVEPSATSGNTETVNLTGDALDDGLRKRGLPVEGKADEKRAAIAAHDANPPA